MVFQVLLHPKAAKFLEKTEEQTRTRIKKRMQKLRDRPERAGKPIKYTNFRSLRIGDYRAIYESIKTKIRLLFCSLGTEEMSTATFQNFLNLLGALDRPTEEPIYFSFLHLKGNIVYGFYSSRINFR